MAAIQGASKHAGAITKMVYKLYSILLQLNQPSVEATAHFSLNLSLELKCSRQWTCVSAVLLVIYNNH